jgi:hypothetical protein
MTKENLKAGINAMLDGADTGEYHDELVTLLSLVHNTSDESIAVAWLEVHIDVDAEEGAAYEEK